MRLTQADLDRLSKTIKAVYSATSVADLTSAVLHHVPAMVPNDATAVTLVPLNGQAVVHHNAPHLDKVVSERLWALRDFLHQHPLESAGEVSATWGATSLSDFLSRQQLQRTDLYNEFYRHVGVDYQLGIYTERVWGFRIGISCNGKSRDFNDRDRTILGQLAPHLAQAYKNVFELARLRKAASSVEAAAEAHGHGFIRIDRSGGILDMTELAGALLLRYFNHSPHTRKTLPFELRAWLNSPNPENTIANRQMPMIVIKSCGKLMVRAAAEGSNRVLLLSEQRLPPAPTDLAALGLRKRESEILFWMCQGKSNPEIAGILGLSVRTIHKHNENIFRRLGVENRHAATQVAAPFLRQF